MAIEKRKKDKTVMVRMSTAFKRDAEKAASADGALSFADWIRAAIREKAERGGNPIRKRA